MKLCSPLSNIDRIFRKCRELLNLFCMKKRIIYFAELFTHQSFNVFWYFWGTFNYISCSYTDSQKHESTLLHTNFWRPTIHVQQNIFGKTLIEGGSSHLYASFGTFCVQFGQFLETQWVFEKCLKTVKWLFF